MDEKPCLTPDLVRMSNSARYFSGSALVLARVVARSTKTSVRYWEELRLAGEGPVYAEAKGEVWYSLSDLQDWLVETHGWDRESFYGQA